MHHCLKIAKQKRPVRIYRGDDGDGNGAIEAAGSANTVEYYTSILKSYDDILLTRKIYAKQAEQLLEWVKSLWY